MQWLLDIDHEAPQAPLQHPETSEAGRRKKAGRYPYVLFPVLSLVAAAGAWYFWSASSSSELTTKVAGASTNVPAPASTKNATVPMLLVQLTLAPEVCCWNVITPVPEPWLSARRLPWGSQPAARRP